jgi:hypothetical protein
MIVYDIDHAATAHPVKNWAGMIAVVTIVSRYITVSHVQHCHRQQQQCIVSVVAPTSQYNIVQIAYIVSASYCDYCSTIIPCATLAGVHAVTTKALHSKL